MDLAAAQQARRSRVNQTRENLAQAQIDLLCDALDQGIRLDGPGSASRVTPEARKKLKGIIDKYKHSKTPWKDCVADNTKRFGPEMVKHVCGVVKALGKSTATTVSTKLGDSCPTEEMDKETFDLLYRISQIDYLAVLGQTEV